MSLEKVVEKFKSGLQYCVGAYIFLFLMTKAWSFIGLPTGSIEEYQIIKYVLSTSILALVSQAVMVSAAIELAYMLFTPGPDEAVDPLILGIAGTALLVMSDENSAKTDSMLYDSIAVFLFAVSLAILFYLRFMLTKWFPKQFKDNFDKGSFEDEASEVESIHPKKTVKESKSAA
ncbi:PTS sugar transporter subunit IIC [Vibrio vulnificus]|uniref:Uncharacterized protein n=1 Tax=Vibrio vulnificus TaxID=672 RepID=A0A8H9TIB7_VIBVL|nr:PTS sugar transporter subunit IIC [Vibrio vulnificus]EGQ7835227.1 hypothetical protein [Vibrio vulnificus]EGR0072857.1 hypothetical protein [Vibrio vulnificus]EGR0209305.1 hypothetical protein [Vibrio vulnificus]EHK2775624.1 PTS sugar transporter subunit IIC [Vibrio vulnificus]EHU4917260.1 PTS sugar transporter subunit IIC [Vibrio vulnificus]